MKLIKSLLIVLTVVSSISAFANSKKATTKGRTPSQAAEPDKVQRKAGNQVDLEGDSAKAMFYSMAASHAMDETGSKLVMNPSNGIVTYSLTSNNYTQFECKHKLDVRADDAAYSCTIIDPYLSK